MTITEKLEGFLNKNLSECYSLVEKKGMLTEIEIGRLDTLLLEFVKAVGFADGLYHITINGTPYSYKLDADYARKKGIDKTTGKEQTGEAMEKEIHRRFSKQFMVGPGKALDELKKNSTLAAGSVGRNKGQTPSVNPDHFAPKVKGGEIPVMSPKLVTAKKEAGKIAKLMGDLTMGDLKGNPELAKKIHDLHTLAAEIEAA